MFASTECRRWDSNPHSLFTLNRILNPARLPIPPLRLGFVAVLPVAETGIISIHARVFKSASSVQTSVPAGPPLSTRAEHCESVFTEFPFNFGTTNGKECSQFCLISHQLFEFSTVILEFCEPDNYRLPTVRMFAR